MDPSTLVASGQALIKALDDSGFRPRLAMWVHNPEADTWRLWIVPPSGQSDKRSFYARVSEAISDKRSVFGTMDAADVQMIPDTHPAVRGLANFIKIPDLGNAMFSGNRFNGFYLPDGIILRSDL
jgi:hypothetical protein